MLMMCKALFSHLHSQPLTMIYHDRMRLSSTQLVIVAMKEKKEQQAENMGTNILKRCGGRLRTGQ